MTRGIAFDLSEMMGARRERDREPDHPASPPDVLCLTLREIAARYAAPCPFKPGDLVTPRKGYGLSGEGEPQIVLEVAEQPLRNLAPVREAFEINSSNFGARLEVRVAREQGGEIQAFWQESWCLEPYTGPDAGRAADAAGAQ